MSASTVHVRRPQPKARGNQFYLDRTVHPVATFCGAEGTTLDLAARRSAISPRLSKADRAWPGVCPECVARLDAEADR